MIKAAIEKIEQMAKPNTFFFGDEIYADRKLYRLEKEQLADPVKITTLNGLVEYLKTCRSDMKDEDPGNYFIRIDSPTTVTVISKLNRDREREKLVICEAEVPRIPFEHFIDNEQMVITVQSMFVDEPEKTDKALILKFAGTATNGSVKEYDDDGVTQKATVRQGVASKVEAIVPSPCTLRPFRTFIEIEQPASQFIFRMREGGNGNITSALIEADGGAWKIKARESIKKYLEEKLDGMQIPIIG